MVMGFRYRLRPHLLWQVYGVENVREEKPIIHSEALDMNRPVCETKI